MPDLKVVAERSEQEIKKQKATRALQMPVREIAANFIRIVRGAGKPEQLARQVNAFAAAFNAYSDTFGHPPSGDVVKEMLAYPRDPARDYEHDRADELRAEEAICRAALQFIASGLLEQRTQRERASRDLRDGISMVLESRERARRRRSAAKKARTTPPFTL